MGDSVGSGDLTAAACGLTRYILTFSYDAPGRDNKSGRSRDTLTFDSHKYYQKREVRRLRTALISGSRKYGPPKTHILQNLFLHNKDNIIEHCA